jgi:hypothetical protein
VKDFDASQYYASVTAGNVARLVAETTELHQTLKAQADAMQRLNETLEAQVKVTRELHATIQGQIHQTKKQQPFLWILMISTALLAVPPACETFGARKPEPNSSVGSQEFSPVQKPDAAAPGDALVPERKDSADAPQP